MEREALISDIERFAARAGMAPSTACLRGVGNPKLYSRLVAGGSCSITTAGRMRRWMATYPTARRELAE